SMLAPLLVRAVRPGVIVAGGLLIAAAGLLVLTRAGVSSGLAVIVTGSSLVGFGVGPVGTLGTDLVVGSAPVERAGAASGVSETSTELGGALGIALLGSLGTAIYRHEIGMIPAGASPRARQTLGGAVDVASALPPRLAERLPASADAAFVQGLYVVAITGAALAVAIALVVLPLLGRRRPTIDYSKEV
ncbi:MAG: MFS transporter, partial [Chloroflexi bacterium]|nr:MFS transporter [Chloroflexota bacterium]